MVDNSKRIDELKRELAKDPRSRQFYQLGELLRREGRLNEAAEVLRRGLTYHTRYVAAWVALGRTCLDLGYGRESEAADALTQALGLDAQNLVAWRLLGESRLACGQRPAALEAMERALALVPGDEVLKAAVEALQVEVAKTPSPLAPPQASVPQPGEAPAAAAETPVPPTPVPEEAPFDFDAAPLALEPVATYPSRTDTVLPPVPVAGAVPGGETSVAERSEEAVRATEVPGAILTADQPAPAATTQAVSAAPPGEVFDVFGAPALATEAVGAAQRAVTPAADAGPSVPAVLDAVPPLAVAPELREPAQEMVPPEAPEMAPATASVETVEQEVELGEEPAPGLPLAEAPPMQALGESGEPSAPDAEAEPGVAAVARVQADRALPDVTEPLAPSLTQAAEMAPSPGLGPSAGSPEAAADASPTASITLARLYLHQQQMGAAIEVLEALLRREPGNQEARELLGLVREMLEVAPVVTPPALTPGERKIASLQRWLARIEMGREVGAP